jgi:lipase maturation factor 1
VARLFHILLATIFAVAWLSLLAQVEVLIGSHGLLPLADFLAEARREGRFSFARFPTLLALVPGADGPSDAVILAGPIVGLGLALGGLLGVWPRTGAALQTVLYLGYATACRTFLSFQWDNLLLECGLLATFLPTTRPARLTHVLFRVLVFKLYFESGLAKWQSPIHDWRDGTAMTFYYETAPLPTALGWYAHHLPRAWHVFESRAVLAIELVAPFAIFGPRRARLGAAALFTVFQTVNAASANYGFFCPLAVALHVFLLDDRDLARAAACLRRRGRSLARWPRRLRATPPTAPPAAVVEDAAAPPPPPPPAPPELRRLVLGRRVLAGAGATAWCLLSLTEAAFTFADLQPETVNRLIPVLELTQTLRMVNAYHLFASVTQERVEPELQTEVDGIWSPQALRFKPGDPRRRPPFVAPHQPRVDFLLWFYGLSYLRPDPPAYVSALVDRLCNEPSAVRSLFADALPAAPSAVRIAFFDFRFSSSAERRSTGVWWSRRPLGVTRPIVCGH